MPPFQKAGRALAVIFVVYALLCATHLGEFWPFSIYPMFSRAGQPWTRAIVRDVTPADAQPLPVEWEPVDADAMPGDPFALDPNGVFQNDLANYVKKAPVWDRQRLAGLRAMLGPPDGRHLLVMKVSGSLDEADAVSVVATPLALVTPDTLVLNPAFAVPSVSAAPAVSTPLPLAP